MVGFKSVQSFYIVLYCVTKNACYFFFCGDDCKQTFFQLATPAAICHVATHMCLAGAGNSAVCACPLHYMLDASKRNYIGKNVVGLEKVLKCLQAELLSLKIKKVYSGIKQALLSQYKRPTLLLFQ